MHLNVVRLADEIDVWGWVARMSRAMTDENVRVIRAVRGSNQSGAAG